jgi:tetratricopeptide (TPR) repeat protein
MSYELSAMSFKSPRLPPYAICLADLSRRSHAAKAEALSLSKGRRRKLVSGGGCALLLALCALLALYPLYLRLMSGIHQLRAENHARQGYYGMALESFKKAAAYQPNDYQLMKGLGDAYYELGALKPGAKESFSLVNRSREFYETAKGLNPLDAGAAYGAARAGFRLEMLHDYLYPEKGDAPYNALPWYREAVRLRPNSVTLRYALARYLFYHDDEQLPETVRDLVRVYPPAYSNLRKEEFWSPEIRDEAKKGLEQAIAEGTSLRNAYMAMSGLSGEEERWDEAVSYYDQSLQYRAFENRAGNYIHLGYLNMKKGDMEAAEKNFIKGLDKSRSREADLGRIYRYYKLQDQLTGFPGFYSQVKERLITSPAMQILLARSLIEREEYASAREVLLEVNDRNTNAEACYWLARIAEKEKDWDSMELLIQKATVLEPENSNYHLVFSNVLRRLKKLERAEKEATLALQYQIKPSPWTFNHRASIRRALEDYEGAARDWTRAIGLKPDYAPFHARAGEAYASMAYWSLAAKHYKKALSLSPDNKQYQKRLSELIALSS